MKKEERLVTELHRLSW